MDEMPKTETKAYEFQGISSGDGDSFCWDISKEDFIKIKGKNPNKYDKSMERKGLYRLYPNDFYGFDDPKCNIKISIEVLE